MRQSQSSDTVPVAVRAVRRPEPMASTEPAAAPAPEAAPAQEGAPAPAAPAQQAPEAQAGPGKPGEALKWRIDVEDYVSEDNASVIDSIIEDLHEKNEFNVRGGTCIPYQFPSSLAQARGRTHHCRRTVIESIIEGLHERSEFKVWQRGDLPRACQGEAGVRQGSQMPSYHLSLEDARASSSAQEILMRCPPLHRGMVGRKKWLHRERQEWDGGIGMGAGELDGCRRAARTELPGLSFAAQSVPCVVQGRSVAGVIGAGRARIRSIGDTDSKWRHYTL